MLQRLTHTPHMKPNAREVGSLAQRACTWSTHLEMMVLVTTLQKTTKYVLFSQCAYPLQLWAWG